MGETMSSAAPIAVQRPDFLARANPLAAPGQGNALDFAGELEQIRPCRYEPGSDSRSMPRCVRDDSEAFPELEIRPPGWEPVGRNFALEGLQRCLHDDLLAAVEVIDQKQRHES